jgi:glycosyltransferase involved in cell wall biosynthesis
MVQATPKVSVILAVNRDDGFLSQAIQSVLTQTLQELELIVVANCCSDELWQTLQAIDDPRVVPFRTSVGQLPFNLNLAIEHARAAYIARMDADDICEPQRLKCQFQFLETHPDIDIVGSNYCHIDGSGHKIGFPSPLNLTHEQIARRLPFESCMPHPTVMFRRASVLEVGGYAYGLYAEDWDLWLRMARRGKRFANIEERLLQYRIHVAQSTSHTALRRNIANVVGLLTREMILTGRIAFAFGICSYLAGTLSRAAVAHMRRKHA